MSDWIYKTNIMNDIKDVPEGSIGFIYIIKQKSTNKKYIGRKMLWKNSYKTINKKKKKIIVESDWKSYWSSSPTLTELISDIGTDDFTKEIIQFVKSKGMMTYAEEFCLYYFGALETNDWFNNNIRSKIYRSWCKPDEAKELRQNVSNVAEALIENNLDPYI